MRSDYIITIFLSVILNRFGLSGVSLGLTVEDLIENPILTFARMTIQNYGCWRVVSEGSITTSLLIVHTCRIFTDEIIHQ